MFDEEDFETMDQSYDDDAIPDGLIDCSDIASVPLNIILLLQDTDLTDERSRANMMMKLVNVSAAGNQDSDIFITVIISLAAMLLALLEQMDIDSRVRFYDEFSEIAKCLESDPVPYWGSIEGDDL